MKKFIVFSICLIILSSCSNSTEHDSSLKPISLNLPPSVEVVVKNIEYSTRHGSYCWSNGNVAKCVDTIHPAELLTEEDLIKVSPGELIALKIGRQPIEQSLSMESEDLQQSSTVELIDNTFEAPLDEGTYTYLYFARWNDNGTGTSGDGSNAFIIEVK